MTATRFHPCSLGFIRLALQLDCLFKHFKTFKPLKLGGLGCSHGYKMLVAAVVAADTSQAALNVGAFGNDELVKRLRSSIFVETAFLEGCLR